MNLYTAWQRAAVGIDWPSDMEARKEMLTVVTTILPVVESVRVIGSPALGLCYVAAGRLHGYSALDLRPWDVAPGGVIASHPEAPSSAEKNRSIQPSR